MAAYSYPESGLLVGQSGEEGAERFEIAGLHGSLLPAGTNALPLR